MILIVMIVSMTSLIDTAFAWDTERTRQSLRESMSFAVLVKVIQTKTGQDRFDVDVLQREAKSKLRMAGIDLVPLKEAKSHTPFILITITSLKDRRVSYYVYNVDLSVLQETNLLRTPSIRATGVTWQTHAIGLSEDLQPIRVAMDKVMEQFITAYISVNPR